MERPPPASPAHAPWCERCVVWPVAWAVASRQSSGVCALGLWRGCPRCVRKLAGPRESRDARGHWLPRALAQLQRGAQLQHCVLQHYG